VTALSGNAVAGIVQRRAEVAGLDGAAYARHSLRAGFATSAAQAGIGEIRIVAQTRHASLAVLRRYVREGRLWQRAERLQTTPNRSCWAANGRPLWRSVDDDLDDG
jgi:site-specific recombinase XerD